MFNRRVFDESLAVVSRRFETTAPTVEAYVDWLASASDLQVTLADVATVAVLLQCQGGTDAANVVYHLQERLGRDTTGHAGY